MSEFNFDRSGRLIAHSTTDIFPTFLAPGKSELELVLCRSGQPSFGFFPVLSEAAAAVSVDLPPLAKTTFPL